MEEAKEWSRVALLMLTLSLGFGTLIGLGMHQFFPRTPLVAAVSTGASGALLLILLGTPFCVGRAIRVLARRWSGCNVRFSRIRYYRLIGVALYLALPVGILVKGFPLGLALLPFYLWWMFAPHVVLVEGDGGRTALRRSRMLTLGEFGATALPATLSFGLFFIGLAAALRLVPAPPPGFEPNETGGYVRPLMKGESYDAQLHLLKHPDGKLTPIPEEAVYDETARTLTISGPPPVSLMTALAWAGIPVLLAGILDPIRWFVQTLLYLNLRMRREGLTPSMFLSEIRGEDS